MAAKGNVRLQLINTSALLASHTKMFISIALFAAASISQTISPTCQTLIQTELSKVECGLKDVTTNTTDIKQLIATVKQDLSKICSTACDAGLKNVIAAIKGNAECSAQQLGQGVTLGQSLDSYAAVRGAICVKTADNKAYCLEKQLVILEPILSSADPQNPTAAVTLALANKDLVCTDCVQRQLEQLKDVEQLKQLNVQTLLDQTCAGKITTVSGGEGTSTTNNAYQLGSMAFVAGLALAL